MRALARGLPPGIWGGVCAALRGLLVDLSLFLMFRSLSSRNPVAGRWFRPGVYHISCQEIKIFHKYRDEVLIDRLTVWATKRTGFVCTSVWPQRGRQIILPAA